MGRVSQIVKEGLEEALASLWGEGSLDTEIGVLLGIGETIVREYRIKYAPNNLVSMESRILEILTISPVSSKDLTKILNVNHSGGPPQHVVKALKEVNANKIKGRKRVIYYLEGDEERAIEVLKKLEPFRKRSYGPARYKKGPRLYANSQKLFKIIDFISTQKTEVTASFLSGYFKMAGTQMNSLLIEAIKSGLLKRRRTTHQDVKNGKISKFGSTYLYSINEDSPFTAMINGVYEKKCKELGLD